MHLPFIQCDGSLLIGERLLAIVTGLWAMNDNLRSQSCIVTENGHQASGGQMHWRRFIGSVTIPADSRTKRLPFCCRARIPVMLNCPQPRNWMGSSSLIIRACRLMFS